MMHIFKTCKPLEFRSADHAMGLISAYKKGRRILRTNAIWEGGLDDGFRMDSRLYMYQKKETCIPSKIQPLPMSRDYILVRRTAEDNSERNELPVPHSTTM